MKQIILILIALMVTSPTLAQVVITESDGRVFWIKEGVNSPYQGLLPNNYITMTVDQRQAFEIAQYQAWKINLAALQLQAIEQQGAQQ